MTCIMPLPQPLPIKDQGDALTGYALFPDAPAPLPAVLIFHDALGMGAQVRDSAERLCAAGYAALVADFYGAGADPADVATTAPRFEAMLHHPERLRARARAWFDHAAALPMVASERVAAIGYCFGGRCALELARSGAPVAATVSYHGLLTTHAPAERGAICGPVAVYTGAHDPFVPAADVAALQAEMQDAGADIRLTVYPDAAHSFTNPDADRLGRDGIAYHPAAHRDSWAGTLALLEQTLQR